MNTGHTYVSTMSEALQYMVSLHRRCFLGQLIGCLKHMPQLLVPRRLRSSSPKCSRTEG